MQNELQRVLNLAKKTGDRVIVFDHFDNEKTYVVMGLDEYEGMVDGKPEMAKNTPPTTQAKEDLTEVEMLDKINGDIAQWKNTSDFNISSVAEAMEDKPSSAKATDGKPVSLKQQVEEKKEVQKPAKKSNWSIPKTVKEAAEQVMEEDKQYSDEVSF